VKNSEVFSVYPYAASVILDAKNGHIIEQAQNELQDVSKMFDQDT
tara:strand:- start:544 stop:678 length:135 start_codon:yes stop_codon:yes gene_type:complete